MSPHSRGPHKKPAHESGLKPVLFIFKVEEAKMEFRRQKLEQWRHRTKNATLTAEEFRAQKSKERRVKQVKGGSLMTSRQYVDPSPPHPKHF